MNFKIFLKEKILNQNNIKYLRLGFAGIAAFVWWCVFYPELCFPQGTYEAVYEMEETDSYSLLQAEGDRIEVGSRLLEWIKQHTN